MTVRPSISEVPRSLAVPVWANPHALPMCLREINRELPQRQACLPEGRSFRDGTVDFPSIDSEPFDQPHRRCAVAAAAVNEGRLGAGRRNRLQKLFRGDRIGRAVERHVNVPQARGFGGCGFLLDLGARFRGRPKVEIETKPIFLISGTASVVIAPAQATVVSSRARFLMPATGSLVTC